MPKLLPLSFPLLFSCTAFPATAVPVVDVTTCLLQQTELRVLAERPSMSNEYFTTWRDALDEEHPDAIRAAGEFVAAIAACAPK